MPRERRLQENSIVLSRQDNDPRSTCAPSSKPPDAADGLQKDGAPCMASKDTSHGTASDASHDNRRPTYNEGGMESRVHRTSSTTPHHSQDESRGTRRGLSRRRSGGTLGDWTSKRAQSDHKRWHSSFSGVSSPSFFGNFDDTRYWDYALRTTNKKDIGHHCRECKQPFTELQVPIAIRRGGRVELRYHESCFSMQPDPRSQPASSANVGKFVESLKGTVAPEEMYRKMRTRGHW